MRVGEGVQCPLSKMMGKNLRMEARGAVGHSQHHCPQGAFQGVSALRGVPKPDSASEHAQMQMTYMMSSGVGVQKFATSRRASLNAFVLEL